MYIKWKAIGLNPFAHINRMDISGNAAFDVGQIGLNPRYSVHL
jgi:hypothetical protein